MMNYFRLKSIACLWVCCLCVSISAQELRMAVVADVHMMAPSLLVSDGKAFQDYLEQDRKMLQESVELLDSTTSQLLQIHPDYVLIPGDLTKDGELASHQYLVKNGLERLKKAGIKALVVPGNHDVNNPHARQFDGNEASRVTTVSAQDFSRIYANYGYDDAISRDSTSLSYVYQLDARTWLLAIDACKYDDNDYEKNTCITSGRIKPTTLQFIDKQLCKAGQRGIRVIAMMHHELTPHWKYQQQMLPDYVVDSPNDILALFKANHVEVCFTGHLHTQDITRVKGIYDVGSGSLVS